MADRQRRDEKLSISISAETKQRLVDHVLRRKLADKTLPARWGYSDVVVELIERFLDEEERKGRAG
jgi:hypothetical protein